MSYRSVTYGAVRWLEMWRRTHRWGLTRGVAVDRMEVQQRGKRERKPQWTSKSTSSKNSAATTPQTWRTSWKTSKADPKAPALAGAFPCPETALRSRRLAPEAPSGPGWGHPTGEGPRGPQRGALEGRGPTSWGVRLRRRPREITQRRCCENPGTQNVSLVSFSEIGTKVPARATM